MQPDVSDLTLAGLGKTQVFQHSLGFGDDGLPSWDAAQSDERLHVELLLGTDGFDVVKGKFGGDIWAAFIFDRIEFAVVKIIPFGNCDDDLVVGSVFARLRLN